MNIGDVIKYKRQKRNMTQAELAEKLKITPQAVSRWEMGISYPDIAMLPLISEALWVSTDELLGIVPSCSQAPRQEDLRGRAGEASGDKEFPLNQSQADSIFDYVPVPVSGEQKRVLVTDDANFMRFMLEDMLTSRGHIVLQARDGQECLNMLLEEKVDVCVLDINMPGMDGLEVLRRIKAGQPEMKVVMLSALSRESNVRRALELGADGFVVKPFQADCLIERVG